MDNFNLQIEYSHLSDYVKNGMNNLNDFSYFLKTFIKFSEQLISNTKKVINNIISEMMKNEDENQSTLTIRFFEFYNYFLEYLKSIDNQNIKLETDILNPLNDFISHLKSQNSIFFSEFKDLINDTYNQKKKYELCKNNYFESSKKSTEQENLIVKILEEKEKNKSSEIDISEANNKLLKLKELALNDNEIYKIEFEKTNKLFEEKNKLYFPLFSKIKDNEESKETVIKFYFEKINHIFKTKLNSFQEFFASLTTSMTEINIKEDLNLFNEKFNYTYKNNIRIPKEELLIYDLYRRNIEAMIQKNKMLLKKENNSFYPSQEVFIVNNNEKKFIFSNEENMIIEGLFLKNDVDNFKFENLCKKALIRIDYAKDFIDKILDRYTKVIGIQILNENNFERLSSIFSNIINNKIIQNELFEINFAICYMSEKTFYQSELNPFYKVYLCQLLSEKNPNLKTKNFWQNLLILKINNALIQKTEILVQKEIKEEEKKENEKTNIGNQIGDSFYKTFFDVKNFFNSNEKINKRKQYQDKFNKYYQSNKKNVAMKILKDFILHFSCFNLNSSDIVEIITETSTQFSFDDESDILKFFMTVINSNLYSIKNIKFNFQKNYFKKDNFHDFFLNKNYLSKATNKDYKILIILNTLKYLNSSDFINLMCLDKKSSKIIMRKVYKNYLLNLNEHILKKRKIPNFQNPEKRIKIWKKLLNFKAVNYTEIKLNLEKEKDLFLPNNIINLDVLRMWYEEKMEETRKSISNILYSLSISNKNIKYSQGMNYIAEFLYLYIQNEEEAFNIFNSILQSTDYADLFANELKRLNKYFYVFDRIINIYLPEVYLHLKIKQVSVTFYITPWFITLFMSAFHHIKDQNNPKIFIWIFDLFILYGWKSIIKIGLCLMKHFENKILSLDGEALLSFLINDILKLDFFQTNNFDRLKKIYSSFKLEKGLIENLECEYDLRQKIQDKH